MESNSDENNFSNDDIEIPKPVEPTNETHKFSTRKPITHHYQPSKKIKFNKMDLRNNLNNKTLNFLMMIGLDDVDLLEFDFGRALEIWNSQCEQF